MGQPFGIGEEAREVLRDGLRHWLRLYRNERELKKWELDQFVSDYEGVFRRPVSQFKLRAAMNEAMRLTKFMPSPEELLEGLAIVEDREPRKSEANDKCTNCLGTGFKMVKENGANKAAPCECRKVRSMSAGR